MSSPNQKKKASPSDRLLVGGRTNRQDANAGREESPSDRLLAQGRRAQPTAETRRSASPSHEVPAQSTRERTSQCQLPNPNAMAQRQLPRLPGWGTMRNTSAEGTLRGPPYPGRPSTGGDYLWIPPTIVRDDTIPRLGDERWARGAMGQQAPQVQPPTGAGGQQAPSGPAARAPSGQRVRPPSSRAQVRSQSSNPSLDSRATEAAAVQWAPPGVEEPLSYLNRPLDRNPDGFARIAPAPPRESQPSNPERLLNVAPPPERNEHRPARNRGGERRHSNQASVAETAIREPTRVQQPGQQSNPPPRRHGPPMSGGEATPNIPAPSGGPPAGQQGIPSSSSAQDNAGPANPTPDTNAERQQRILSGLGALSSMVGLRTPGVGPRRPQDATSVPAVTSVPQDVTNVPVTQQTETPEAPYPEPADPRSVVTPPAEQPSLARRLLERRMASSESLPGQAEPPRSVPMSGPDRRPRETSHRFDPRGKAASSSPSRGRQRSSSTSGPRLRSRTSSRHSSSQGSPVPGQPGSPDLSGLNLDSAESSQQGSRAGSPVPGQPGSPDLSGLNLRSRTSTPQSSRHSARQRSPMPGQLGRPEPSGGIRKGTDKGKDKGKRR
ncbi:hypothetical protein BJX76DRAFT_357646 [Aspergillus varians]